MKTERVVKPKWFPEFKESLPNVEGKVFVITGTTSGTGYVAAQTVAEKGGEVVCLNRKSQRVTDATEKLQKAVPSGKFVNIACDLQDFDSVKQAAAEVKSKYTQIYCVSCNAGISNTNSKATKDGCDDQMQTNHLSHFILIAELYPLLEAHCAANRGEDARVVIHSSEARNMTEHKKLERKYLEKNGGKDVLGDDAKSLLFFPGGRAKRYNQSKLANSVMMHAMHEKLQSKGSKVKVTAAHPGGSVTSLGNNIDLPWYEHIFFYYIMIPFVMQSAADGTMGLLRGMMAEDAESGVLYGPVGMGGIAGPAVPIPPEKEENDPEAMTMLWEVSEETTGVKFSI